MILPMTDSTMSIQDVCELFKIVESIYDDTMKSIKTAEKSANRIENKVNSDEDFHQSFDAVREVHHCLFSSESL
jgi:hypothetical protein